MLAAVYVRSGAARCAVITVTNGLGTDLRNTGQSVPSSNATRSSSCRPTRRGH